MTNGQFAILLIVMVSMALATANSLWLIQTRVDEIIRRLRGDE